MDNITNIKTLQNSFRALYKSITCDNIIDNLND